MGKGKQKRKPKGDQSVTGGEKAIADKTVMKDGGMAYGKKHMYAAGGSVTMNSGLRALKAKSPEAFNKITGN